MGKHVLVQKSGSTVAATGANPSLLADGQIAIYNGNTNAAVNSAVGLIPFYMAQGVPTGRNPRLSPIIKAGAVKSVTKKERVTPVQPVINVGYQGSGVNTINFIAASGTATVPYGIKIENLITLAPPFPKVYAQYTLTAAQGVMTAGGNNNPVWVCDQLAKSLNQQLSVMPSIDGGQFAFVDVLSDLVLGTAPHSAGTSPTYSIANNSTTLTITAGATDLVLNAGAAVGCWIRIGGSATTLPIYQIIGASVAPGASAVASATLTLSRPYVGTSLSGEAIANLKVGASASILPASSNYAGLKISVTGSYFTSNAYAAGKLNMMVNVPLMDTLAGTPEFVSTAMVYGSGTYNEILKKEMQALGDIGVENRIWMPLPNDTYAVPGAEYNVYSIYYENPVADKSAQGQGRVEAGTLDICVVYGGSTVNNFETALASITGISSGNW